MTSTIQPTPIVSGTTENPRILGLAGGLLFALGLIAAVLVWTQSNKAEGVSMVLNAAVLLSLGYPAMLYSRSLQKIADLERRLLELEQHSSH